MESTGGLSALADLRAGGGSSGRASSASRSGHTNRVSADLRGGKSVLERAFELEAREAGAEKAQSRAKPSKAAARPTSTSSTCDDEPLDRSDGNSSFLELPDVDAFGGSGRGGTFLETDDGDDEGGGRGVTFLETDE